MILSFKFWTVSPTVEAKMASNVTLPDSTYVPRDVVSERTVKNVENIERFLFFLCLVIKGIKNIMSFFKADLPHLNLDLFCIWSMSDEKIDNIFFTNQRATCYGVVRNIKLVDHSAMWILHCNNLLLNLKTTQHFCRRSGSITSQKLAWFQIFALWVGRFWIKKKLPTSGLNYLLKGWRFFWGSENVLQDSI